MGFGMYKKHKPLFFLPKPREASKNTLLRSFFPIADLRQHNARMRHKIYQLVTSLNILPISGRLCGAATTAIP
jgi:two-component SAPR family response regulator